VVVLGGVAVGGRLLFFEVEGNPWQLPLKARDWTGFGESYDNNVSVVTEKGTEADGKTTKRIDKTTTTERKLQPAKTLWDWASLLLAPATLAGLGFWFQSSQERAKRTQEKAEQERSEALAKVEKNRSEVQAKAERNRSEAQARADKERVADQQREAALQDYFDYLSTLLVDKQLKQFLPTPTTPDKEPTSQGEGTPVASAEASDATGVGTPRREARIDAAAALDVVRAKTLALFRLFDQADPTDMPRKASVLAFLGDSGLLAPLDLDLRGSHWVNANLRRAQLGGVDLSSADLSSADLSSANLSGTNLSNAVLTNANLWGADLSRADLSRADLSEALFLLANLGYANLSGTNLNSANLTAADLTAADLTAADLSSANLSGADLSSANLRDANLRNAKLSSANFLSADLRNAHLFSADLRDANLSYAKLSGADLSYAKLSGADLRDAKLSGANFLSADLRDAHLFSADLRDAIFVVVDLSTTAALTQAQLEGDEPPYLCHVTLPAGFTVDPQRDCAKLPAVLLERYPEQFKDLEEAKVFVDSRVRQK
jgi:uncharacterized protein YjbI with pentapeptide repeats